MVNMTKAEGTVMGGFIGASVGATYCMYQGALRLLKAGMDLAVTVGASAGIRTVQDLTLKSTENGILQYQDNIMFGTAVANAQKSLSQFPFTHSARTFLFRELGKGVAVGAIGGALVGLFCAVALNNFSASREKKSA